MLKNAFIRALAAGPDSIVAQYDGNTSFAAANSTPMSEVVVGFAPPPSLTVTRGQSLVIPLTLYAPAGSNLTFMLSCSGLPAGTNCSFDHNPITTDPSSTNTIVNVTLSTMAGSKLPVRPPKGPSRPSPLVGFGLSALLAALATVLMALLWRRAPGLRLASCACLALCALALVMAGCGAVGSSSSNGSPVTPLGPASFTLTGTSGATTISTVVNVTVQ